MTRLALVGVGKIALDRHVPAIRGDAGFELVATASPHEAIDGVPAFGSLDALLAAGTGAAAVAICTPPGVRHALAAAAIAAGLHVLLEKPPAATVSQAADLAALAARRGVTLFAAWHLREAGGVAPARAWLAGRRVAAARVIWHEDVRRWHPGQEWLLAAGGYGAFDPGINALSILTAILPVAPVLRAATLAVPRGRGAPIAARLRLAAGEAPVDVDLDISRTGEQVWRIEVDTDAGTLALAAGGAALVLPGAPERRFADAEYPRLYRRFAELIAAGACDVDLAPLRLVADAFLVGEQRPVAAFSF